MIRPTGVIFYLLIVVSVIFVFHAFTGCSMNQPIPDFKAHITLPASEDGYWVKTVSAEEGRIPKDEWAVRRKRGIILLKEDWMILRNTLLENCLGNPQCNSAVGIFDGLFKSIDEALGKIKKK